MAACGNTMKSQNVTVSELLPGFVVADKGGVVRIAELQSQGVSVPAALRPGSLPSREERRSQNCA